MKAISDELDTTNMTTAKLRAAAREAAEALRWQDAADLMQLAIDRYPPHHPDSAIAKLDKDKMREALANFQHFATRRTLRIYTFGPGQVKGEPKLGAVHDHIPACWTDADIIQRFGIPAHWRAEIEGAEGIRIIQHEKFLP